MNCSWISCLLCISVGLALLTVFLPSVGAKNRYDDEEEHLKWEAMETPANFTEDYPFYLAGYDYEGRPVWVMDFWKWNFNKLVAKGDNEIEKFENYTEKIRYRIFNSPQQAPLRLDNEGNIAVDSWAIIVNMEKFNLKHLINYKSMQLSLKMWAHLEVVTENMDYGFIVNTNFVAERFINTLKPVIGKLLGKLSIRGTRRDKWLPEVLKFIPKSILPVSYGGDRKENLALIQ